MVEQKMTISGRGVIMQGARSTQVDLALPVGPVGEFLITDIHVGPEIEVGNTMNDMAQLGDWAVSVPVYQRFQTMTQLKVSLTAAGHGPAALSARLPAGQPPIASGRKKKMPVTISLLGTQPAQARFEFNLHLTGGFATPFVSA